MLHRYLVFQIRFCPTVQYRGRVLQATNAAQDTFQWLDTPPEAPHASSDTRRARRQAAEHGHGCSAPRGAAPPPARSGRDRLGSASFAVLRRGLLAAERPC